MNLLYADLGERLKKHNEGGSGILFFIDRGNLAMYHVFIDKEQAIAFEKYLKTGSGNAFAKKRLW